MDRFGLGVGGWSFVVDRAGVRHRMGVEQR